MLDFTLSWPLGCRLRLLLNEDFWLLRRRVIRVRETHAMMGTSKSPGLIPLNDQGLVYCAKYKCRRKISAYRECSPDPGPGPLSRKNNFNSMSDGLLDINSPSHFSSLGWRDNTAAGVFILHAVDPGLIPSILYVPPSTIRSNFWAQPWVIPEHHRMRPPNQSRYSCNEINLPKILSVIVALVSLETRGLDVWLMNPWPEWWWW